MAKAGSAKKVATQPKASHPYGHDEAFQFLEKPHTITAMLVGGVLLVYYAFTRDATVETASNVKRYVFSYRCDAR